MAKRTTLGTETLEALGSARLAALVMELTSGDTELKRRLTLMFAGPEKAALEISKRFAAIAGRSSRGRSGTT